MLKTKSQLEIKVNEKIYQFLCDHDSPLTDVKEAIFQFSKYVDYLEESAKAQQDQQKEICEEEDKVEAI